MVIVPLISGCVASRTAVPIGEPRVEKVDAPAPVEETQKGERILSVSTEGTKLTVSLADQEQCRTVHKTREKVTTENQMKLDDSGRKTQTWRLAGAGALALAGGLTFAINCQANDPSCDQKQLDSVKIGVAATAFVGAGVLATLWAIDAARSGPKKNIEEYREAREEGPWTTCDKTPSMGEEVRLVFGRRDPNGHIVKMEEWGEPTAVADMRGNATFDLAQIVGRHDSLDWPEIIGVSARGASKRIDMSEFQELASLPGVNGQLSPDARKCVKMFGAFSPSSRDTFIPYGTKIPADIDIMKDEASHLCSAESAKRGVVAGKAYSDFMAECGKQAATSYCEAREKAIAEGRDPEQEIVAKYANDWLEAQKGLKSKSKAALAAGQRAVAARLKSPSTAKLVDEAALMACPGPAGGVLSSHTVDAQNGFGAMIREEFCAYSEGDSATVVSCDNPSVPLLAVSLRRIASGSATHRDVQSMNLACNVYSSMLMVGVSNR